MSTIRDYFLIIKRRTSLAVKEKYFKTVKYTILHVVYIDWKYTLYISDHIHIYIVCVKHLQKLMLFFYMTDNLVYNDKLIWFNISHNPKPIKIENE